MLKSTELSNNSPTNSVLDELLLVDIGGTHTKIGKIDSENIYLSVILLEDFPTNKGALFNHLECYSEEYKSVSVSVAAPIINDNAKLTFNNFSLNKKELETHFSSVFMLNDYEAAAYGLINLSNKNYLRISNHAKHKDVEGKNQLIFGVGTGIGVSFRNNNFVTGTETGFSGLQTEKPEEITYLDWRFKNGMKNDLHSIVARDGIYDLVEYSGNTVDRLDSRVYDYFFVEDSYNMKSMWTSLFAKAAKQTALTFKPIGGLFITGGTVHRYSKNINWKLFNKEFSNHDKMQELLSNIPLNLLNKEIVLNGCHNYYNIKNNNI